MNHPDSCVRRTLRSRESVDEQGEISAVGSNIDPASTAFFLSELGRCQALFQIVFWYH